MKEGGKAVENPKRENKKKLPPAQVVLMHVLNHTRVKVVEEE